MDAEEGEIVISDVSSDNDEPPSLRQRFHRSYKSEEVRHIKKKRCSDLRDNYLRHDRRYVTKNKAGNRYKPNNTGRLRNKSGNPEDDRIIIKENKYEMPLPTSIMHNKHGILDTSYRKTKKRKRKGKLHRVEKNASDINKQWNHNKRKSDKRLFQNVLFNQGPPSTRPVSRGLHNSSSLMKKLITAGLAKELPSASSDKQLELDLSINNPELNIFTDENTPQSADTAFFITKKENVKSKYPKVTIEDSYCLIDSEEDDSEIEVIIPPKKIPDVVTLDSDGDEVDAVNSESKNDITQNAAHVCDDENSKILKSNIAVSPRLYCSDSSSVNFLNSEGDLEPYSPSSPSSFNSEDCSNLFSCLNKQVNAGRVEQSTSNNETDCSNKSVEIIKCVQNQTTQIAYEYCDSQVEQFLNKTTEGKKEPCNNLAQQNYFEGHDQENNVYNKQNTSEPFIVQNLQLLLSPKHQINNDILSDCSKKTNLDDKSNSSSSFHNNDCDRKQIQSKGFTNSDTFSKCSIKDNFAEKLPNHIGTKEQQIPVTDFILQHENLKNLMSNESENKNTDIISFSDKLNKVISSVEFEDQIDPSQSSNCGGEQNNKYLRNDLKIKLDTDEIVVLHRNTYLENSCIGPKDMNMSEDKKHSCNQEENVSTIDSDGEKLSVAQSAEQFLLNERSLKQNTKGHGNNLKTLKGDCPELNMDVLKCDDDDKNDDDDDLSQLRLIALSTKGKTNQNQIENKEKLNSSENIAQLNCSTDDDCSHEEDILQLRVAALKSAVIKKHEERRKRGLIVKKRKRASSDDFPISSSVQESSTSQCLPSESTTLLPEGLIDSPLLTDGITDSLQGEEDMEIASDNGEDIIQDDNFQAKPQFENQLCNSWELSNSNDNIKSLLPVSSVDSESVLSNYPFILQPVDSSFTTGCSQPFTHVLPPPLPPPNLMFPLLPPPPPPPPPPPEPDIDDVDAQHQLNQSQYNNSNEKSLEHDNQLSSYTEKSQHKDIADDQFCTDLKIGNTDLKIGNNDNVVLSPTSHQVIQRKSDSITKLCAMANVKMPKLNCRQDQLRPNLKTIPVLTNIKKNKLTKKKLKKMQKQKLKKKTNECNQEPRLLCITNTPNLRGSKSKVNLSVKLPRKCSIPHYSASMLSEGNAKQLPTQNQTTLLTQKASEVFDDLEGVNDSKEPLCDNSLCTNNISNLSRHTPPVEENEMDLSEMIVLDEVGMSPEHKPKYDKHLRSSSKNDEEDENTLRAHALTTLLTKTIPTRPLCKSHSSQSMSVEIKDNYKMTRYEYASRKTNSETKQRDLENISVTRVMDINDPSKYRLTRVMKKEPTRSVIQDRESLKVVIPSVSPPLVLASHPSPPLVDRLVINVGQDSDSDDDGEWLRKVQFEANKKQLPTGPEVDNELERSIDLLLLSARQTTENTRPTLGRNKAKVLPKTNKLDNEKKDIDLSETPLRLLPKETQEEYYRLKKIIEQKERQLQNRSKTGQQRQNKSANQQIKPVGAKQQGKIPQQEHLTAEKASLKSFQNISKKIETTTSGSYKRIVNFSDESSCEAKQDISIYHKEALNDNTKLDCYKTLFDFAGDNNSENNGGMERTSEDKISVVQTEFNTVQNDKQANDADLQSTYNSVDGTNLEESNTKIDTEFRELKSLNDKNEVNYNLQSPLEINIPKNNGESEDNLQSPLEINLPKNNGESEELINTFKCKGSLNYENDSYIDNERGWSLSEETKEPATGSEDLIQPQHDSSDLNHANENRYQTEESICFRNKPSCDEEVLTANQAVLLNERFVLLEELSKMSESLINLEREQACVNKEVININQLRNDLIAAEQKLLSQSVATQRLEQALYEAHESVYSRYTRIEQLEMNCRELGTRLRGPQYETLPFANELMWSKIQQVNEKINKVRLKREMIKTLMENSNMPREKLEDYCAQRKNELENKCEGIKNSRLQEPNISYIAPLPVELITSKLPEHCASIQCSTTSSHVESTLANLPSGISSIQSQITTSQIGSSIQSLNLPFQLNKLPPNRHSSSGSDTLHPPGVISCQMAENDLKESKSLPSPCSPPSSKGPVNKLEPQLSSSTEPVKIVREQDNNQVDKSKSVLKKHEISEVCGSLDYSSINKKSSKTAMDIDTNVMESESNPTFSNDLQNNNKYLSVSKYKLTNKSKIKPMKSRFKYNSVLQYKQPIKTIPSSEVTGDILCRYEMGGTCQDQHCKYKHFPPRS